MDRKIIVDIDNTLWDFAPALYEAIQKAGTHIIPPDRWRSWDFWKPFLPAKRLYEIIRDLHMVQDRFPVYPDARKFLEGLKESGLHIIIASHREQGTMVPTLRWLEGHGLPYDDVHLSHDKTVLFPEVWAVVDDSPITLQKAKAAGIVRAGLKNPWNEGEDAPLFDDLMEILSYIRRNL